MTSPFPPELISQMRKVIEDSFSDGNATYEQAAEECAKVCFKYMSDARILKATRDMKSIRQNIFDAARCGNLLVLQPSTLDALQEELYDENRTEK